jgi:hypothetical protein
MTIQRIDLHVYPRSLAALRQALESQIEVCLSVIDDAEAGHTTTAAKHQYAQLMDDTKAVLDQLPT